MPKTYLVPPAPPQNEGKTVAAWTFSALVLLGAILFALGMVTGQSVLLLVGIGAVVLEGESFRAGHFATNDGFEHSRRVPREHSGRDHHGGA